MIKGGCSQLPCQPLSLYTLTCLFHHHRIPQQSLCPALMAALSLIAWPSWEISRCNKPFHRMKLPRTLEVRGEGTGGKGGGGVGEGTGGRVGGVQGGGGVRGATLC